MHGQMFTHAKAASYSRAAALVPSTTILARKLSVYESSANKDPKAKLTLTPVWRVD